MSQRRPSAPRQPQRKPLKRPWWSGPLPIAGTLLLVAAVVAVMVLLSRTGTGGQPEASPNPNLTAEVAAQATSIPPQVIDSVGAGGVKNPLKPAAGGASLTGSNGKPQVLYMGAEYCPYCAAERWSLVVALSRFGTLQGLSLTTSSSSDIFPDTPTFSFHGSSYQSDTIAFSAVELEKRDRSPLQTPSGQQQQVMSANDPAGSIPFIDIGGRYVALGAGYQPDLLAGKSPAQVAAALTDASSPITKAIVGNANWLTAAICKASGAADATVCGDPVIHGLETQL